MTHLLSIICLKADFMTAAVSLNSWAASKTGPLAPPKKPSATRIAAMSGLSDWWCWYRWWSQEEPLRPDPALKQKGKSCCGCKNITFCANTACCTHRAFCTFYTLHYSALQSEKNILPSLHNRALESKAAHSNHLLAISWSLSSSAFHLFLLFLFILTSSCFFLPRSLNFLPHDAELALQKTVLYSPRRYAAALLGGSFRLTHFQRVDLCWIFEEEETNPIFYMIPFLAFNTTNAMRGSTWVM